MLDAISAVYLDRFEYCRYEEQAKTVRARVIFSPDDGSEAGEVLTCTLRNEQGLEVLTKTVTLGAGAHPKGEIVEFALEDCVYTPKTGYRFFSARLGKYYVEVSQEGGPSASSSRVWFLPCTPENLRSNVMYGMTTAASEILAPIAPLAQLTGVRISVVSDFCAKGTHAITYDASEKTLRLDSTFTGGGVGAPVTVVPAQRIYVIADTTVASGEEYFVLDVDYYDLPDSDVTEQVFIDNQRMTDDYIRFFIREGYGDVVRDLACPIEPTWITTDWDEAEIWHQHTDPLVLEKLRPTPETVMIRTNLKRMLYLDRLVGKLNDGTILTVEDSWRVEYGADGIVSLVPQPGAALQWLMPGIGLWWLSRFQDIPNFWHFRALAGLEHLREENAAVIEAIRKFAAVNILITAGSAYRAGYSSESVSRDGIAASQSYTSSAMYGIYSADQVEYKEWLNKVWYRFKKNIRGIQAVVL